jgi:hypothetical protein
MPQRAVSYFSTAEIAASLHDRDPPCPASKFARRGMVVCEPVHKGDSKRLDLTLPHSRLAPAAKPWPAILVSVC